MAGLRNIGRSGQAALEFAFLYAGILLPLTFGIVYVAQMYWVWHSMTEFTRQGAQYAATHCWEASSTNVREYMQTHVPVNIDKAQFQSGGSATINVDYFSRDPATGQLGTFDCQGDCSTTCVPDTVTVSVTNYEFRRFVAYLKLPPVPMPSFQTSVATQGNGCDPEQGTCNP
jgi:Flp pilus assembly protein TadG